MKLSIAQLRAAGVSDKQILDALATAEAERLEKEREQSKFRSRKYRERVTQITQITRDERDERDGEKPEQNQRARQQDKRDTPYIDTSSRDLERKKSKKVSISADWKPTDADRDYARAKGWPDSRIDTEAERFRIHYLANGKPWANWHLVWCKWVISSYQSSNVDTGGQQHGRRHGSVLDALDRLGDKLKAEGASDDYVPGSSGPRPLSYEELMGRPKPDGVDQKMLPIGPKLISAR